MFAAVCVAAEIAVVRAPVGRPLAVTAMIGLGAVASAILLVRSMGYSRTPVGVRLLVGVPLLLSFALAVVLLLEAHAHGPLGGS